MKMQNADVLTSGLIGDPEALERYQELHKGPALTLIENKRPTFCMGLHMRPDGWVEPWVKLTKQASIKLVIRMIRRALSLIDIELVAQIGGRDEYEEAVCERFMARFGFEPNGDKTLYEVQRGKLMMTLKRKERGVPCL